MQAMPQQLADALPAGTVRLHQTVRSVAAGSVLTDDDAFTARAIVVAVDPTGAAALLGRPGPVMRGLTTVYFAAPDSGDAAATDRLLHVDLREGPVINAAIVSAAAPTYAPPGRRLIQATYLGAGGAGNPSAEQVRDHAGVILGLPTSDWELVEIYSIPEALPTFPAGRPLRSSVVVGEGIFVAGDHRDTPSIQGALVSGRRAAEAVLAHLGH